MKQTKRDALLTRNRQLVSLPTPKLDELSNEELEKRADILEATFDDLFDE